MKLVVSGHQMKQIDQYTIDTIGIPSLVLMERAALAVADEISEYSESSDRVLVVCGIGNNGADGIAVGRILMQRGFSVEILLTGNYERSTKEWQQQLNIARKLGVRITEDKGQILNSYEILVDAIFGVGLCREITGDYKALITSLNGMKFKQVIAVDIPSGIHSDTGEVLGVALRADKTVTFGYEKLGSLFYPGKEYSKTVVDKDIGFPVISLQEQLTYAYHYEQKDLSEIPKRPAYSNKGMFGKVLIVAGCENMSGAAYFSALASFRMGAGVVRILTVDSNRIILQQQLPEAIVLSYDPESVKRDPEGFDSFIKGQCEQASVVVVGPGLGKELYAEQLVKIVLTTVKVPCIIDADGLNVIASHPSWSQYYNSKMIITPHLGEMARLTGKTVAEIQTGLLETAAEYRDKYGITCVLKDAVTVVAQSDGRIYINTSGNSSMAKAGSGDVLTGIIAGLLALGLKESQGASLGVYIHGLAGDRTRMLHGTHGTLARELADAVALITEDWRT